MKEKQKKIKIKIHFFKLLSSAELQDGRVPPFEATITELVAGVPAANPVAIHFIKRGP